MNCRKTRKLMYLYKKGELEDSLYQKVKDHINKCEHCDADWQKLKAIQNFSVKLQNHQPVISHSEKLTTNIMEVVKMIPVSHQTENRSIFQDLPIQWLTLQKVRIALSSILVILALTFIFEYGYILNNISNLERHITSQTNSSKSVDIINDDCIKLIQTLPFTEKELTGLFPGNFKGKSLSRQEWLSIGKKLCRDNKINPLLKNRNSVSRIP